MENDWLIDFEENKVGAVLLDLTAASDIFDHEALRKETRMLWF